MKPLFRGALAAALSLLVSAPVLAADNYTITSGGATRTLRAKDLGTAIAPMSIAIDGAGLERFTTSNPGFVTFPPGTTMTIQGLANGTPIPTVGSQPSNIATGQFSCGTTAAQAVAARTGRRNVLLIQEGTTLVRIGASSVTPSTGAPLPGTAYSAMTIDGSAAVFCVTGSGSQTISYVETY